MIAPLALAALAFALAWPVPVLLSRAHWPSRSPAVALVLWQAIALAGGLSMIGALLTFGLQPFGEHLVQGVGMLGAVLVGAPIPEGVEVWHLLALCAAVLLGGHLLLNLVLTIVRSERERRRHEALLTLLSSPLPQNPDARIIDTPAPVAYCLPGPLHSITVLSAGLVEMLTSDELQAVIEHERAHVHQRHDVVLIAFRAWHASLPWFPIAGRARQEVEVLVEMLADDRARHFTDDRVLARAIALVGSAGVPAPLQPADVAPRRPGVDSFLSAALVGAGDAKTPEVLRARVMRLLSVDPLPTALEALVVGGAMALIAVPTVLLLAPALLPLV